MRAATHGACDKKMPQARGAQRHKVLRDTESIDIGHIASDNHSQQLF